MIHREPTPPLFSGEKPPTPHETPASPTNEADVLRKNIRQLLTTIAGQPRPCKECGADIWFITTAGGKQAPITAAGLNHFTDCPSAAKFRRPKA